VISLLRPCYCLFFSCRRSDFLLIFLELRSPPLFFSCCLQGRILQAPVAMAIAVGHERKSEVGCPPSLAQVRQFLQQGPSAVDGGLRA
jgi:hypothetical protein